MLCQGDFFFLQGGGGGGCFSEELNLTNYQTGDQFVTSIICWSVMEQNNVSMHINRFVSKGVWKKVMIITHH